MNRLISSLEYRRRILVIALLCGMSALSITGCQTAGAQTPTVTKGRASLIRFPKPWVNNEQGEEDTVLHPRWYEVRLAADSSGRELLFAGMMDEGYTGEVYSERPKESWYSLNFYAVGLGEKPRVRAASKVEWDRAARVSGRPKKLFPNLQEDLKLQSFEYGGRKYTKSSDNWGAVLLSPGGRWLAVFSYSGRKTQGTFWTSGEPRQGDIYWDVYDTKTGSAVLSWNARAVSNPAMLGEGAVWAGEEYLVMPFDMSLDACVIGLLSQT